MKRTRLFLTVAILFALLAVGTVAAQSNWRVGDHALINWTGDGYWYPGTIVAIEGSEYYVVYDDGDREWVGSDRIRQDDLLVGTPVSANWLGGGIYYPGVIAERTGNAIVIHYDDGDVEATTIAAVRVR